MTLKTELQTDPLGIGYAANLASCHGLIVDQINAQNYTMIKPRMVTARTVLAECGAHGVSILEKLESISAANTAVKWAMKFLQNDGGLDVGNAASQSMITQLEAVTVFTAAEATALRNLALQPASRAEVLGLVVVTEAHIRAALES